MAKKDKLIGLDIFPELTAPTPPEKCTQVVVIPSALGRTTYRGRVIARAKDGVGTIRYVQVEWPVKGLFGEDHASRWESVYDVFEVEQ